MKYRRRFVEIIYPEQSEASWWNPECAGFRAHILANPVVRDISEEDALYTAMEDDALDAYWQGIADRVPEWNYQMENSDGVVAVVPAPGERPAKIDGSNWQAFWLLPMELAIWLRESIHRAHRPGWLDLMQGKSLPPPASDPTTDDQAPVAAEEGITT